MYKYNNNCIVGWNKSSQKLSRLINKYSYDIIVLTDKLMVNEKNHAVMYGFNKINLKNRE